MGRSILEIMIVMGCAGFFGRSLNMTPLRGDIGFENILWVIFYAKFFQ